MSAKRKVEIFSAGCSVCREAVEQVRGLACGDCVLRVLDMHDPSVARRAKDLGVRKVPAVVVDGKLAECCMEQGIDERTLKAAGVGVPLRS
jgi:glutaredoxin 3